jgi:hypothetical protein
MPVTVTFDTGTEFRVIEVWFDLSLIGESGIYHHFYGGEHLYQ